MTRPKCVEAGQGSVVAGIGGGDAAVSGAVAIAAALGSDVVTVRLPMKKLIDAGQARTEGERRGMMYFLARGAGRKSRAGKTTRRARKAPRAARRRVIRRKRADKAKTAAANGAAQAVA